VTKTEIKTLTVTKFRKKGGSCWLALTIENRKFSRKYDYFKQTEARPINNITDKNMREQIKNTNRKYKSVPTIFELTLVH
jgi:hypothetical protein